MFRIEHRPFRQLSVLLAKHLAGRSEAWPLVRNEDPSTCCALHCSVWGSVRLNSCARSSDANVHLPTRLREIWRLSRARTTQSTRHLARRLPPESDLM